jgi:hypothetical protein
VLVVAVAAFKAGLLDRVGLVVAAQDQPQQQQQQAELITQAAVAVERVMLVALQDQAVQA